MIIYEHHYKELLKEIASKFTLLCDYIKASEKNGYLKLETQPNKDSIEFSIGLQRILLRAEILIKNNNDAKYLLKTFKIIRNIDDYGKLRMIELPALLMEGNYETTYFTLSKIEAIDNFDRTFDKTIVRDFAPEYLFQLVKVLNAF